ncbi:hypothetical protein DIPPA_70051 [Diplonema papillatum]|nr:hypothetical protein DIPPA_70051 [Diplonema papillatum]
MKLWVVPLLFALSRICSIQAQTCGNGERIAESACCLCDVGFAPPACTTCLDGYMMAVDPATKKDRCYTGVSDCHDLLPAPWGCSGRGTCVPCAPADVDCYPTCECSPGYSGDKCEGTVSDSCFPESVHMYTVYPQQPESGEEFTLHLWGCSIDGSSTYQVLPVDLPCGAEVADNCQVSPGDKLAIQHSNTAPEASTCTSCGECSTNPAWELRSEGASCSNTSNAVSAATLGSCLSVCESTAGCVAVDYFCRDSACNLHSSLCTTDDQMDSNTSSIWLLAMSLPVLPIYESPIGSCSSCNADAAGSDECEGDAMKNSWRPISNTKACEGSSSVALLESFRGKANLQECMMLCDTNIDCHAVDWFCLTKRCDLYDMPCSNPTVTRHGAASFMKEKLSGSAAVASSCSSKDNSDVCFTSLVSFEAAKQACTAKGDGWRLCFLAELTAGSCCGTGCDYHQGSVWILDDYKKSSAKNACPAMAQAHVACPSGPTVKPTCQSVQRAKKVACCSDVPRCYASKNVGGQTECYGEYATYNEARDTCEADGKRLCTSDEVGQKLCCGLGCGLSIGEIWTNDIGQIACTDDELEGKFSNPAGQFHGCQQSLDGSSLQSPEQCKEENVAEGSIRCCSDTSPAPPTPIPQRSNRCNSDRGEVTGTLVKNGESGCFTIASRETGQYWSQQGSSLLLTSSVAKVLEVRLVSPFVGLDETCSVNPRYTQESHPNHDFEEPCSLRSSACLTCTAAIELCSRPGYYAILSGGILKAERAPSDVCMAFKEADCKMAACAWSSSKKTCTTAALESFAAAATFRIYYGKDFTNHTSFESLSSPEQNLIPSASNVVARLTTTVEASSGAWLLTEVGSSTTSQEAAIPGLTITGVPSGGDAFKVCQKKDGEWAELQTHDENGFRRRSFTVLGSGLRSAAADEEEDVCCSDGLVWGDVCIPWWAFLLVALLVAVITAAFKRKLYSMELDARRHNEKYSNFEMDGMEAVAQQKPENVGDDV